MCVNSKKQQGGSCEGGEGSNTSARSRQHTGEVKTKKLPGTFSNIAKSISSSPTKRYC